MLTTIELVFYCNFIACQSQPLFYISQLYLATSMTTSTRYKCILCANLVHYFTSFLQFLTLLVIRITFVLLMSIPVYKRRKYEKNILSFYMQQVLLKLVWAIQLTVKGPVTSFHASNTLSQADIRQLRKTAQLSYLDRRMQ